MTINYEDFVTGNHPRTPILDRFFKQVQGLEDPLSMLTDKKSEERILLTPQDRALIKTSACETIANHNKPGPYEIRTERGLSTYEDDELGLPMYFSQLTRDHLNFIGRKTASVLDAGCGEGNALADIFRIPGIDREQSIGVTTPIKKSFNPEIEDRIVEANIINIGAKIRFLITISVVGAHTYHPFNRENESRLDMDQTLATLQLINFTEINGLVILNSARTNRRTYDLLQKLIEMKILCVPPHAAATITVYMVLRHPTIKEIFELLEITPEGYYLMAS